MKFFMTLTLIFTAIANVRAADDYDVVVYGGTSAGVTAAVQAARMDHSVILISPAEHLGGITSSGLGATDSGRKTAIGGLSLEFYQRIHDYYEHSEAWIREDDTDFKGFDPDAKTMWRFEPHVAELVFEEMIKEAGVPVVRDAWLDRDDGVSMKDGRIISITTLDGTTYRGKMFIDATYEGDLMAAAGVSYTVGRESNDQYNEFLNGVQVRATNTRVGDHYIPVDPYIVPGDPTSGMLPGIHPGGPGEENSADEYVQAYCFRLCTTDVPENRVEWPKPKGYDPGRYELLLRWMESGQAFFPLNPRRMPNRKTDTNNHGFALMSTDYIGGNYDYPEASYQEREAIVADHVRYTQGLMWTLANHPRVPKNIRDRVRAWGLAKDEFQDNGNWPYRLYIREARRMIGDYVMTAHDARRTRTTSRPIGLGSYSLDSHHVQRYVAETGFARNEGNTYASTGGPYQIAYGSITPKREECENMLVPVCLSSSHIAYGSIRMEPVFMILGQSAATAAVQAINEDVSVQGINYEKLCERLLADGQVLVPPGEMPPPKPPVVRLDLKTLQGIVIDDSQAKLMGDWTNNDKTRPFLGDDYHHNGNSKTPMTARFRAKLPATGRYEVRLAYPAHANRATNTPVTIHHANGTETVRIDQREPAVNRRGRLRSLGTFRFTTSQPAVVVIGTNGADGYVVVDAVQFVPVKNSNK